MDWAANLISIGALAGLTTVVMVLMLGQIRVLFAMSRDGLLPRSLSRTGEHGTPVRATILVGGLVAAAATFFPAGKLEEMVNVGTLFAFILVSAGVMVLRRTRPDLPRSFRVPALPVIGVLAIAGVPVADAEPDHPDVAAVLRVDGDRRGRVLRLRQAAFVAGQAVTFLCLDVGSTWTKGALVAPDGTLLGVAQHETTPPEVLTGVAAVTAALPRRRRDVLACSSAGGGLRLAVVGQERLVSAEAGHRVALSAGAKVVHVSAGELSTVHALRASRPDVVLLVGGTDGGDEKVLLHNAARLARARVAVPIVLAGNKSAQPAALELLARPHGGGDRQRAAGRRRAGPGPGPRRDPRGVPVPRDRRQGLVEGTALPPPGAHGDPGRGAVRRGTLAGRREEGAVLVVDVGGATTDVYSAVSTVDDAPARTVALPPDRRTVEGDIGMRVSAPGVVAEAITERLLPPDTRPGGRRPRTATRTSTSSRSRRTNGRRTCGSPGWRRPWRSAATCAWSAASWARQGATALVLSGGVFRHAASASRLEKALRADLGPVLRDAQIVGGPATGRLGPAGLLAQAGHTARRPPYCDHSARTTSVGLRRSSPALTRGHAAEADNMTRH